jgi:hypothetical protein
MVEMMLDHRSHYRRKAKKAQSQKGVSRLEVVLDVFPIDNSLMLGESILQHTWVVKNSANR